MHSRDDPRLTKFADAYSVSFDALSLSYERLYPACVAIPTEQQAVVEAMMNAWNFVDACHRIRELSQATPGLSRKRVELKHFLAATRICEEYRHYVQHLRQTLSTRELHPSPVWGALSWVDPLDNHAALSVVFGEFKDGTQYSSCVYDTVENGWVSKVALALDSKSLNFDPVYSHAKKFKSFLSTEYGFPLSLTEGKPKVLRVTIKQS